MGMCLLGWVVAAGSLLEILAWFIGEELIFSWLLRSVTRTLLSLPQMRPSAARLSRVLLPGRIRLASRGEFLGFWVGGFRFGVTLGSFLVGFCYRQSLVGAPLTRLLSCPNCRC